MVSEDTVGPVLCALADPTRRQIVELLSSGEGLTISEITGHFGISRQAVSKHLDVLNGAGIVAFERQGRDRCNRLQASGFDPLREWFSHYSAFWDERLAALKRQVEQEQDS